MSSLTVLYNSKTFSNLLYDVRLKGIKKKKKYYINTHNGPNWMKKSKTMLKTILIAFFFIPFDTWFGIGFFSVRFNLVDESINFEFMFFDEYSLFISTNLMSSESLLFKFDIFLDFIKKATSLIELNRIIVLGIMKATKNLITKNHYNNKKWSSQMIYTYDNNKW